MRILLKKLLLITGFFGLGFSVHAQLIINESNVAQALAQKLVGEGVTISNPVLRPTSSGVIPTGFFYNIGGTNISIDSGIVITNGRAKSNFATNTIGVDGNGTFTATARLASANLNLNGDNDLANATGIPFSDLFDAMVLEFDVTPLGDTIRFRYSMSSEEYTNGTVCTFNDAFALLLSGPGIAGIKNLAIVPGTSMAVTIKNVNDIPTATGPGSPCVNNPQYYVANGTNVYFTHQGHTKAFIAESQVQPCQTYHLKFVIADRGDHVWDTGVFIEAGSLTSNSVAMTNQTQTDPVTGMSYLVEGCAIGAFDVRRPRKESYPLDVNLSYGGTAINGVDVIALPLMVTIPANDSFVTVTVRPVMDLVPEGIEELRVYALATGCVAGTPTDSTIIQLRDYDILSLTPDTAIICRNGSIQLQASPGYTIYQWQPDPTLSNANISNPTASPVNHNTMYICTASVGTCNARDSVLIDYKDMEFISKTDVNCRNGSTGQIKVAGGPEWTPPVEFSLNGINWQSDSTFNNLPVGVYWVKMRDAFCIDSVQVNIIQARPDLFITNLNNTDAGCSGGPDGSITVSATGGNGVYQYSIDGINFQASNLFNVVAGTYTITIRDGNGCTDAQSTTIVLNDTISVDAGIDGTICEGTSYLIPAVSNGRVLSWSPATALSNPNILNPVANPVTTTKYYLTATTGICTKIDSVQVFVRPAPVADAGTDIDICYGRNFQLHGNGGTTYQWSPSTYFISPSTAQNPDVKAVADISYALMVKDIFNCQSLVPDIVNVKVVPPVKIFAGNDTIAAIGQPIQLNAVELSNAGVTNWSWSPPGFLSNPVVSGPVATLTFDQRLTVTGTTPAGCQGSDDILIKVFVGPEIYVPSGFTPNNDGLNDILKAIPVGIKEFKYLKVYDRAGQLVFSTTDYKKGWDGKINGMLSSTTVFVWLAEAIDYKGNPMTRKGVVTIIQ